MAKSVKPGRKPIGRKAMTPAQRQQRRRARLKKGKAAGGEARKGPAKARAEGGEGSRAGRRDRKGIRSAW